MIEDRVKDILAEVEALRKVEDIGLEIDKQLKHNQYEQMDRKSKISEKKRKLGELISPIRQNIMVQINNQIYCVFYNQKYGTASIVPAMSVKDAETQLAVHKMQNGEAPNGRII
jgi:uncharacterized protein involved in propanediol utilization